MIAGRYVSSIALVYSLCCTLSAIGQAEIRRMSVDVKEDIQISLLYIEDIDLYFGEYEVDNHQYAAFDSNHDSGAYRGVALNEASQPVVRISWNQAMAFCRWLQSRLGKEKAGRFEVSLPTVNEWEFLASNGGLKTYPWGPARPVLYGNYADRTYAHRFPDTPNSACYHFTRSILAYDDGFAVSCPVGDAGRNSRGIYGLSGNVREWCLDPATYRDHEGKRKEGRSIKGLSWRCGGIADLYEVYSSMIAPAEFSANDVGFRIVVRRKPVVQQAQHGDND